MSHLAGQFRIIGYGGPCRTPGTQPHRTVVESNGLGSTRERCYQCAEGRSAQREGSKEDGLLPSVAPGQLRCQKCACGVPSNKLRFCEACARKPQAQLAPYPCVDCGSLITPGGDRGRPRKRCVTCRPVRRGQTWYVRHKKAS